MKKIIYILLFFGQTFVLNSQSNLLTLKISDSNFDEIKTWRYLLGLNSGSTILFYIDKENTSIFMKKYNENALIVDEKAILNLEKKETITVCDIIELDDKISIFLIKRNKVKTVFYRIDFNSKTMDKFNEFIITEYMNKENEFYLKYRITKNDISKNYFILTKKDSIIKIYNYNYDNVLISLIEKKVSAGYILSSFQDENRLYFTYNHYVDEKDIKVYENPIISLFKVEKADISEFKHKVKSDILNEYKIIGTQLNIDSLKNIHLAVSYCSLYKNTSIFSTTEILRLDNKSLTLKSSYLLNKNILNFNENDKLKSLNVPTYFGIDHFNKDLIIYQHCTGGAINNIQYAEINSIGLFNIDELGDTKNLKTLPLKYFLYPEDNEISSFLFKYNIYDKPNAIKYSRGCDISEKFFKFIKVITYKNKTLLFYNDNIENINITSQNEIKEYKYISKGIGMISNIIEKQTIMNKDEQVYFDFSTGYFNEKTGIYSVISISKTKKCRIAYLNLN